MYIEKSAATFLILQHDIRHAENFPFPGFICHKTLSLWGVLPWRDRVYETAFTHRVPRDKSVQHLLPGGRTPFSFYIVYLCCGIILSELSGDCSVNTAWPIVNKLTYKCVCQHPNYAEQYILEILICAWQISICHTHVTYSNSHRSRWQVYCVKGQQKWQYNINHQYEQN